MYLSIKNNYKMKYKIKEANKVEIFIINIF